MRKGNLKDFAEVKENLIYWLSKTSEERISIDFGIDLSLHNFKS